MTSYAGRQRRRDGAIDEWEQPARPGRRWPLLLVVVAVVGGALGARSLGAGVVAPDDERGELSVTGPAASRPAVPRSPPGGGADSASATALPEGVDPRVRRPEGPPPRLAAMAPGPLAAREYPASAWTGTELVITGGVRREGADEEVVIGYADTAAYDPTERRWRVLPDAPGNRVDARAVWTGSLVVVVGGGDVEAGPTVAPRTLALDPRGAGVWRLFPPVPVGGAVEHLVWTGREVVASVVGAERDDVSALYALDLTGAEPDWRPLPPSVTAARPAALFFTDRPTVAGPSTEGALVSVDFDFDTGRYRAAAFDLARAAWATLPGLDEAPGWEARFVVAGDELVAVGRRRDEGSRGAPRSAWRLPLTEQGAWDTAATPRGEIDPSRLTTSAWTGSKWLLAGGGALGGLYDPTTDTWGGVPPLDQTERFGAASAWTGEALLVWGGTDNQRAFADGLEVRPGA